MKLIISFLLCLCVCISGYAYENFSELIKGATAGDPIAQYELGLYYTGLHNQSDYNQALKYLRLSSSQGNRDASELLAALTCGGYDDWGDFALTPFYDLGVLDSDYIASISASISAGYSGASLIYAHSLFNEKKYSEAIKYYKKTLSNLERGKYGMLGDVEMNEVQIVMDAVTMLGYCYEHGLGVKRDQNVALAYYEMLGNYSDTPDSSVCSLIKSLLSEYNNDILNEYVGEYGGQIYDGFAPSPSASRAWSKCAILYLKLGKFSHAFDLILANERYEPDPNWDVSGGLILNLWAAESYYKGIGRNQDLGKAFKIFKYIIESSGPWTGEFSDYYPDVYADACYRLYECYALGRGVAKDSEKAKKYFKEALRMGSSSALYDDQKRYEILKQ